MRRPVLVISLVTILAVGVPAAVWIWESLRPKKAAEMRADLQGALSPPARSTGWFVRKVAGGLEYMVTAGQVRRANELLQNENARLKVENNALRETLKRYERLDAAARLAEARGWRVIEADTVAYGPSRWPHGLVINRGSADGVAVGDPVLHLTGLVGVVLLTTEHTATVQTLAAPQSAIGAIVLPNRARGIVLGVGRTDRLELVLEDPEIRVQPGLQIISSGAQGSLYPPGLDIGTVGELGTDRFGQAVADVTPSASFSRVEEVLILKASPEPPAGIPDERPQSAVPGPRMPEIGRGEQSETHRERATP